MMRRRSLSFDLSNGLFLSDGFMLHRVDAPELNERETVTKPGFSTGTFYDTQKTPLCPPQLSDTK